MVCAHVVLWCSHAPYPGHPLSTPSYPGTEFLVEGEVPGVHRSLHAEGDKR